MNIKLLTVGLLGCLMMTGSILAMESKTIQEYRENVQENHIKTAENKGKFEVLGEMILMIF